MENKGFRKRKTDLALTCELPVCVKTALAHVRSVFLVAEIYNYIFF